MAIIIMNLLYGRRVRRLRHRTYHTLIILYTYASFIGAYYPARVEVAQNNKTCRWWWVEEEY